MGIFDKLRAAGAPNFDPQRAIMTIVIAAIKSDGVISDEELGRLQSMCARSLIYAANTGDEDSAVIRFADTLTEQAGDRAIDQAAAALTPELRETAFAFACDMVLADGIVTDTEERYLTRLSERLSVAEDVVEAVVRTTIIRNRGL